jgi:hypothetical protein
MEGPGILDYGCYKYHGKFDRNLPKGPGCFVFEKKFMQHGFYVNLRNPAFDYVGADKLALDDTNLESKRISVLIKIYLMRQSYRKQLL